MKKEHYDTCEKQDGEIIDWIRWGELKRKNAVKPPGDAPQCFDRSNLLKLTIERGAKHPFTGVDISGNWITNNLKYPEGTTCLESDGTQYVETPPVPAAESVVQTPVENGSNGSSVRPPDQVIREQLISGGFGGKKKRTQKKKRNQRKKKSIKKQKGGQANLIRTDRDIYDAVEKWYNDRTEAEKIYGHISNWDTSQVTNMARLFKDKSNFDDDISKWDVSNVTNMYWMFRYATSFNQPIGAWDTHNVTNMEGMFAYATSFNQPIDAWDTHNVTNMKYMFYGCCPLQRSPPHWYRR